MAGKKTRFQVLNSLHYFTGRLHYWTVALRNATQLNYTLQVLLLTLTLHIAVEKSLEISCCDC